MSTKMLDDLLDDLLAAKAEFREASRNYDDALHYLGEARRELAEAEAAVAKAGTR